MVRSEWQCEFFIEKVHRACICGICHKQISSKVYRLTINVTSGWKYNDYHKWFHMNCLIDKLNGICKEQALELYYRKLHILQSLQTKIEEIK